jgi:hypothetical protein
MVPWLVVACLHAIARKPARGAICQSRLAPRLISSAPILLRLALHRWRNNSGSLARILAAIRRGSYCQ